jgi:catechol 2,3-dioxygenase-like lactoylglutathione lyase family enzyme
MLDHVSIGVSDIGRTKRFYDHVLRPLGYSCLSESKESLGYGADGVEFWIYQTERPIKPDPASGLHFSFSAPSRKSVGKFHAAALGVGGEENGKPGVRKDYSDNYYAAFVIDPDGYRIEAHCESDH